jgi:hypothetical protein
VANPESMSEQSPGSPNGDPGLLREVLEFAERIFWCNTNREAGPGGNGLEQRMHARSFAAAWLTFNYEDHMRRVRRGDVIVMYARLLGVIGMGRATESRLEILGPDHPDRLRAYATEGENEEEWRIPVEWLVWHESNPAPVDWLRPAFQEITDHVERIRSVRQHYLPETV